MGLLRPPPNRKGGSRVSGFCFCGILLVLRPLARERTGRNGPDFRLSGGRVRVGASGAVSEEGRQGIESMEESAGVKSGVGDCNGISNVEP